MKNILNILLNTLSGILNKLLIERKTTNAETIIDTEMSAEIVGAMLYDALEREMIGERVDVGYKIGRHAQLARIHVVDAELQGLVVEVVIELVGALIGRVRVHVVREVARVMVMMMVVVRVVIQRRVQFRVVVVVRVVQEVAQVVRQAEEQLRMSAVLVPKSYFDEGKKISFFSYGLFFSIL